MRFAGEFRASRRLPLLQVAKSIVATLTAWLLGGLLFPATLPIFAAIAALLVVQPSVNQSLGKGIERSVGVIVGVILASVLGLLLGPASWVVLLAIIVASLTSWGLKLTSGTSNQVAISAMLVLALGQATPQYALDRVLETVLGAFIGIVVNALIVPPVLVEPARRAVVDLGLEVAASMDRLAHGLADPQRPADVSGIIIEARLLRPMTDAAEQALDDARESLALNPRRQSHRRELEQLEALLERLRPITTQLIGMTRAFHDHYDESLHDEPSVRSIRDELERAAHDVRLLVRPAEREPEPMTTEIPVLTAPLALAPPRSTHWVLIGSLMEDLRRIHEGIVGEDDAG